MQRKSHYSSCRLKTSLLLFIFTWSRLRRDFFYVREQIRAIENRYRAELEKWKLESVVEIWTDSVNRSHSTPKGRIAEQMAPVLPGFLFNPADARFMVHR